MAKSKSTVTAAPPAPEAALITEAPVLSEKELAVSQITPSLPAPTSSWAELALGTVGSTRRDLSYFATAFTIATLVRVASFSPLVLGNYLLHNLGPVERESVRWSWILAVRAYDIALGMWVWKRVEGYTRKDGAVFGALVAAVSRISLYAFERAYFLLSTQTIGTILLLDIVSLACAFALLPVLLPHSLSPRPSLSGYDRIKREPELLINLALAAGISICFGAFTAYTIEHLGGTAFVKSQAFEVEVPSYLSSETLTPAEMISHPTVSIPSLRSFLKPGFMSTHIVHAALEALFVIPLTTILPQLRSSHLAILAFLLIAPPSTALLYDILPLRLPGALAVGAVLGARAAVITGVSAWVLEELRMNVYVEHVDIVAVDEETKEIEAVAEIDAVLVAAPEADTTAHQRL